jgi:hypothetical protein
MDQPHGFQPVHSGHEDIEEQEIEIPGFEQRKAPAAVAGGVNAVTCPFQQNPDGRLHGNIIVDDQDLCQRRFLRPERESIRRQVVEISLNFRLRASTSSQKGPRGAIHVHRFGQTRFTRPRREFDSPEIL